jgi:ABC-type nickel/cobalt efflux system permease component RcnA/Tol biopolymer transport system component
MKKQILLFSLALALIVVRVAQAHPADMYFHTYSVSLSPDGIQITWEIVPGPMLAQTIWHSADQNQDQVVSNEEAWAWTQTIMPSFSADFDGTVLALDFRAVEWPSSVPELIAGEQPIRIHLQADWPVAIEQAHQLTLQNHLNPKNSVSWFDVQGKDGILLDAPEQDGGRLSVRFERSTAGESAGQLTTWESGRPSIPWVVESLGLGDVAEQSPAQPGVTSILEGFVKAERTSPLFILAAMVIAVLLGALHALSPGHGKTIVAAYLVGAQGKFYHAFALGAIVTLTHTGSVFVLGLLTLTASRYFMTVDILPILEFVSGVLIFFLGIGLLYPRLRGWRINRQRQRQMQKSPPVVAPKAGGGTRVVVNQPIEEIGPPHSHDPSEFGYIPRGLSQGNPLAEIRWRSLVTLGISGGLVPCPDAIAILLIAVTINRIAFGLSLIAAFSVGLAVILIVIGLLIVQGKRLFERLRWFDRVAYAVPVLSALVVLGLGAALTVGAVQRRSGGSAGMEDALPSVERPAFDLQQASVIYTVLDEDNKHQFFSVSAMASALGAQPEQMTAGEDIWNYAVSPDRSLVVYATPNGVNSAQLWQLTPATAAQTLLLDCPDAFCSGVVWSPDGLGILYGRLESGPETNTSGVPSIWWLDLATRETAPLFQDAQMPGFNPRWSPDGRWLSYTSINPQEIQIYDVETGASQSLPTQTGDPAVWSPDGEALLLIDLEKAGELYLHQLFRYDLAEQELTALDTGQALDENYPTWSPDGKWIALVRREWGTDTLAREDQIWLMRPDGSEAHPVTQDRDIFHSQPAWSPDGRYLLYEVNSTSSTRIYQGIQLLDIETGEVYEIAAPGNRPAWLQ